MNGPFDFLRGEHEHECMEEIFRHEEKSLESYLIENVALKGERQ